VKGRSAPLRKACAGTIALVIGVICIAPPCAAADQAPAPAASPSLTKLSPASLAVLRKAEPNAQSGQGAGAEAASFFKSKKGAAVIVLFGAGFGYALYSKNHDRVMSPIRE